VGAAKLEALLVEYLLGQEGGEGRSVSRQVMRDILLLLPSPAQLLAWLLCSDASVCVSVCLHSNRKTA